MHKRNTSKHYQPNESLHFSNTGFLTGFYSTNVSAACVFFLFQSNYFKVLFHTGRHTEMGDVRGP